METLEAVAETTETIVPLLDNYINLDILKAIFDKLILFVGTGFVTMTILIFISFGVFKAFTFVRDLK